jgi:hypothetical protein
VNAVCERLAIPWPQTVVHFAPGLLPSIEVTRSCLDGLTEQNCSILTGVPSTRLELLICDAGLRS